ncbi:MULTISPECIES: NAD(P)-dependent oxidoreductase [unclassified Mucilaginibacter]|uniref:NAD(P)-dependent oxidoreductase n=1 Tax=unclassified Mucilaginibacter TaxID=2617802 RepID=UPI002AC99D78|nr:MULTISPECIES: NAD(P)-dependent oxidoreductase [unclassified Mucilaginibacter]MEB0263724.1 NAD(P)-dependent oxidoreductase [Mucilaginibacter sp. 10I4]MEB0277790.1 NAD(P)-dependent oxidoreductase [Mucilaginibacter sp. 10B2]MEB0301888.1 NAD(P)-dependent oxidoreductase [Mucilaginibacter sp. 5C4]WPX24586.1 NAD(P)-dependent oxidoreductase [Mucilaginibacter sp. 5C4]
MTNTIKIGWIGLGLMGNPMSQQLLKAGYPVTVYNRHKNKEAELKEQGATTASTPKELLQQTGVVIIMVTDDKAIREIFTGEDGLLKADVNGKVIINMSTVSPAISKEMAELCKAQGLDYLDAPVSGSVKQAETAQLVIMVGGDAEVFEKVKPVLETIGKLAVNVGEVGAGNAAKLAINTLLSFYTQGLAEAVILAKNNGIKPEILLNLIGNAAIANPYTKIKGDAIVNDNFKAAFSLKNIVKDLKLSRDIGLTTPLGEAALKTFEAASENFGDEDLISIYKYLDSAK